MDFFPTVNRFLLHITSNASDIADCKSTVEKIKKKTLTHTPVPFSSIFNDKFCCDSSLEPFRSADSNEGSQLSFLWRNIDNYP